MNPTDLAAALVALEEDAPDPGEIHMADLPVGTPDGPVRAGRDANGHAHILVPVAPGTPVRVDRRSRGVTIDRREFVVGADRRVFADVRCEDRTLADLFERLACEMLDGIAAEPGVALEVVYRVLGRWRTLLETARSKSSEEVTEGLFGELWVLRKIVVLDPSRSLACWTGPTHAKHDFTNTAGSLEVKTTMAREGRFVEIHGANQLAPPTGGGDLHLVFLRIEHSQGGHTVSDLIADVVREGADPVELNRLVDLTGWRDDPDSPKFVVHEEQYYLVDDSFPRIVPDSFLTGSVPPGVLRLSYRVDLSGSVPAPLDEAAEEALIVSMAVMA